MRIDMHGDSPCRIGLRIANRFAASPIRPAPDKYSARWNSSKSGNQASAARQSPSSAALTNTPLSAALIVS